MTEQDIFDIVYPAMIKQGKPAIDEKGNCKYRAPDGSKCAVGHLLEDDEYNPEIEGNSVEEAGIAHLIPDRLLPHVQFLVDLQHAHDVMVDGNNKRDFRETSAWIVSERDLKYPEIEGETK